MTFFAKQYETLSPQIYRYLAVRTGDKYLAEDLTSEVFLKSLKYETDFETEKKAMGPYLFRMAHHALIDHVRKHKRETVVEEIHDIDSLEDLEQKTHETIVFEQVETILKDFSQTERDIILLKIVSGMTFLDIANALDIKENTVKTKYFRTLKHLEQNPEAFLSLLILCQI